MTSAEALTDEVSGIEEEVAAKCRYASLIVARTTTAFLQSDLEKLETVGIGRKQYRDAYEARNAFYQSCSETLDLRAVGFEEAPRFPIDRGDFPRMQVILPPADEDAEAWHVGILVLKVASPNWDKDDRQRQWKGRDGKGRERFFRIDDDAF